MRKKKEIISRAIIRNISYGVTEILDTTDFEFEDILFFINDLSEKEKYSILLNIINSLLYKLINVITIDEYNLLSMKVDRVIDYYTSSKKNFSSIKKKSKEIAEKILYELIEVDNKKNLNIDDVKKVCYENKVKNDEIHDVLMLIVIRYITFIKCQIWEDYLEKFKKT